MAYRKPLGERNYSTSAAPQKASKKHRFTKDQIAQDYRIFTSQTPSAVPLSESDLVNPTPEKIQQVFLSILNCIQAEPVDRFKQAGFVENYSFDNPEMLEDITFQLQFCCVLKKLLVACNIHDFGLLDLNCPDSKRTIRVLGSLFNLLRFQTNVFEGDEDTAVISEEIDTLKDQLSDYQASNSEAAQTLRQLEREREEERELETEIKHAIMTQEQESHSIHLEHDSAVLKYQAVEDAYSKAEQKQMKLEKELDEWKKRNESLHAKIVKSPEKLLAEKSKLEKEVQEANVMKDEAKNLLIKWESIVSNAHHVQPIIDTLNHDLTVLTNKSTKKSELATRLRESEDQVEHLKHVLREGVSKHQNLMRHLKLIEVTNHAEYEGQHTLPRRHHLDGLQSDVNTRQKDIEDKDADFEKETAKIQAKIASIRERYEEDCTKLEKSSQKLHKSLQSHMERFFRGAENMTGEPSGDDGAASRTN